MEKLMVSSVPPSLTIDRWNRRKAPLTIKQNSRYMGLFVQRSGMTPDAFLAFAKSHEPVEIEDLIEKIGEGFPQSVKVNFVSKMRSFVRENGWNNLPRGLSYVTKEFHPAYSKEEIRSLLSYLDSKPHKLYVLISTESGLRANTVLALKYRHIKQDFEAGLVPCALRLEPSFYQSDHGWKKKAPGFTFIGERSLAIIRELVKDGVIQQKPEAPLVDLSYTNLFEVLSRALDKAGGRLAERTVDGKTRKIQPNHSLRRYFENALDDAHVDHEKKMVLEGHFAGSRAKSYTDREFDNLRPIYREAYPHIDPLAGNPEQDKKLLSLEDQVLADRKELADLRALVQKLLDKKRGPA